MTQPPARSIPADDRGLLYGDGVYRTCIALAGEVWQAERQFQRLADDCNALGIAPPDTAWLAQCIAADCLNIARALVRITVTRGGGARGYRPPLQPEPQVYLFVSTAPEPRAWNAGWRLRTCDLRLALQPRLAGIKHLNRLENVLARGEWDDPDIDDGLLLDARGCVVETVSANLFWAQSGRVFTPSLDASGIRGVQRDCVLESLQADGVPVEIGDFDPGALLAADEAWVCNSVIGVRAVTALDRHRYTPGPLTRRLAAALACPTANAPSGKQDATG